MTAVLRPIFGTSSNSWVRATIVFMLAWIFLVYIFVSKLTSSQTSQAEFSAQRINEAMQLLETSKQRNDELQMMIKELISTQVDKETAHKLIERLEYQMQNSGGNNFGWNEANENDIERQANMGGEVNGEAAAPSEEYELLRRRIQSNIGEMWNYFSHELATIRKRVLPELPSLEDDINQVLLLGAEHKRSLLSDMNRLRQVDGYEVWRSHESKALSDLVQSRLNYLQNPKDCRNARKLVCKLNKGCGYGCQLHHVVYCFIVAYATERTLILKSRGWRYHKGGWEEVFHGVSDTCFEAEMPRASNWPGTEDSHVLVLPIIDSLMPRPPYLPLAVPADLAPRLQRLHGDPIVWWVGQFLKYLLRPQPRTRDFLEAGLIKLGFKKPIVGVHVRRTDKVGTEAAYHSLEEYMTHVEDYFLTQEVNGTKLARRIFLASDDARVLEEAQNKYPHYEIIGDSEVARLAAVSTRYTDTALNGIILDIHLLSLSDYLVCTFSSQVCRVAYEIMQSMYADASDRFKSLDDIYYYGGQNAHNRKAVIGHSPRNHEEMQMHVGDLVGVAGNHWNGYSKGKNTRTNQVGLFPSFKVVDHVETVNLPIYPLA